MLGAGDPIKQANYVDANESIEKWTGLLYFIMAKFTPKFSVLISLSSIFFAYFTTGLTDEDYVLVIPLW